MNAQPIHAVRGVQSLGKCRLCGAGLSHSLVDLGKSPLCETFLTPEQTDRMEPFFPLHVLVCDACWLVQLKEYVAAEGIFTDHYPYYSSFSTSWVEHARKYCELITARRGLNAQSFAVELACNDGYLLQHFPKYGVTNILGVEPTANTAEVARGKGIPVTVDFFGVALAEKIKAEKGKADLVLGNNVLAHVPDLNDFVGGVKLLLKDNGIATFEFPHLQNLIEQNQFDTIYHEHFCYFSAIAIDAIAKAHGLVFFDVEEIPTHGGSLRLYAARQDSARQPVPSLDVVRAKERVALLDRPEGYLGFIERVKAIKADFLKFIADAKRAKKTVAAYGAAAKGNTFLNYCGVTSTDISCVFDRSPAKQGKILPGSHIPVYAPTRLAKVRPDFLWILPWNLENEIATANTMITSWGGQFVVAVPRLRIFS